MTDCSELPTASNGSGFASAGSARRAPVPPGSREVSGSPKERPAATGSPTEAAPAVRRRSKLAPPAVPAMAVPRARLVRALEVAVERKVTLLVAPPGSGKSVLLGQWAASQPRLATAWLTIDSDDNDASRFAQDLCATLPWSDPGAPRAALDRLDPGGREMGSAFVATLLSGMEDMPPTVLVLDDFQQLTNTALLGEFDSIVEHAPPSLRLLLSTRVDPALRYHRLLVRDEVAELRQGDLAFDRADAERLIALIARCHLNDEQIDTLVARTEGWAAGLQLAALSFRGCRDVDQFVKTFAGDDRHVADYLTEQVLSRQSPAMRRFLLRTSVLDRMSASLCDLMTGDRDGQATLERLDRGSMFIIRLDNRRGWFRYQQLFQTLLRHHLRAEDADLERVLLARAADWHFARDDVETAIHYLIAGRAWERVLDAAFVHGRAMYAQGRAAAVAGWIETVPPEVRSGRTPVVLLDAAAGPWRVRRWRPATSCTRSTTNLPRRRPTGSSPISSARGPCCLGRRRPGSSQRLIAPCAESPNSARPTSPTSWVSRRTENRSSLSPSSLAGSRSCTRVRTHGRDPRLSQCPMAGRAGTSTPSARWPSSKHGRGGSCPQSNTAAERFRWPRSSTFSPSEHDGCVSGARSCGPRARRGGRGGVAPR